MKKRDISVIAIMITIFATIVISCAPSKSAVQTAIAQTQVFEGQIQTAIAQTQVTGSQLSEGSYQQPETIPISTSVEASIPTWTPIATDLPTPMPVSTEKPKTISLSQSTNINSCCLINIKKVYFDKVIKPSNPGNWYRYYETKSADTIYLDIVITIKNTGSMTKAADDFLSVSVEYDNQYDYDAFAVVEYSDGSDFTYANITGIDPLLTGTVHYLVEVPLSMKNSGKSLVVNINAAGEGYQYRYR